MSSLPAYETAPELTAEYVEQVWETLPGNVRSTVFLRSPSLSEELGCDLTIATETFQHTGSFKYRAAYNLLSSVPNEDIVASSSGNFGQAVAYASKLLGKQCTVVMPQNSARVKIEAVQGHGAQVDLIDTRTISRAERVQQILAGNPGWFEAKPYDDYRVIAGNSTLGNEILTADNFDSIVVPVGGGGLASGIIVARDLLGKTTEIIGAEPLAGNDASRSLRSGTLIKNEHEPDTLADGARTISLGATNWEILRNGMADCIEVDEKLLLNALRQYFLQVNLKVEPTGALSLAAVMAQPELFRGKKICCVVSGGNVDSAVYGEAIMI